MSYPGGKGGAGVYQQIINTMPPHRVYIEPFLGAGAVLRHKRPAEVSIGVDLDHEVALLSRCNLEPGALVYCGDGIEYLRTYDYRGGELVYCDPPNLMETRSGKRLYRHEMGLDRHVELLETILDLPCRVMVSGYWSALYGARLADWSHKTFQAATRGGRPATEWLWFNFPTPLELHDYRYLGADFRERERIGRKKKRWIAKLASMPTLERQALLAAIAEAWEPTRNSAGDSPVDSDRT